MLKDIHWGGLGEMIRAGLCTPFIGAGACYGVLPLARTLAEDLLQEDDLLQEAELTGRRCPLRDRSDLSRAAQYLAVTYENSTLPKIRIANRLKSSAGPDLKGLDEPHRVLAACGLPIYLTTNYDDFMLRALNEQGASPIREYARWTRHLLETRVSKFDAGWEPTPKQPLIFHLHGCLEDPQSMVATDDDYLDFLVNWSRDLALYGTAAKAMLPPRIRSSLTEATLLFVGYSFNDMSFRVILRGLAGSLERSARKLHIAVQVANEEGRALDQYFDDYLRWSLDISVFWGTARQFSNELQSRLFLKPSKAGT